MDIFICRDILAINHNIYTRNIYIVYSDGIFKTIWLSWGGFLTLLFEAENTKNVNKYFRVVVAIYSKKRLASLLLFLLLVSTVSSFCIYFVKCIQRDQPYATIHFCVVCFICLAKCFFCLIVCLFPQFQLSYFS